MTIDEELAALEAAEKVTTYGTYRADMPVEEACAQYEQGLLSGGDLTTVLSTAGVPRSVVEIVGRLHGRAVAVPKLCAEVRLLHKTLGTPTSFPELLRPDRKLGQP